MTFSGRCKSFPSASNAYLKNLCWLILLLYVLLSRLYCSVEILESLANTRATATAMLIFGFEPAVGSPSGRACVSCGSYKAWREGHLLVLN